MEKGLLKSKNLEYLISGTLEFDPKKNRLLMRRPDLLIGSDRLDFYDFLGRRRESLSLQNRNWLKFCVAMTAVHFVLVGIPTMFSKYFGDHVGVISEKMGAIDESQDSMRMQRVNKVKQ